MCLKMHFQLVVYPRIEIGEVQRLEFSGQGELDPRELREEIEKKNQEYQNILQPLFLLRCEKNEVKLEIRLAAGFNPKKITVDEARNTNARCIVLDSHFKKEREYIYGHVECNVALVKGKDVGVLLTKPRKLQSMGEEEVDNSCDKLSDENTSIPSSPLSPCWYPLSWRSGFPRAFAQSELDEITSGFANKNLVFEEAKYKVYTGILQETPVLVTCFSGNDERFWSALKALSRVRHRNILNFVGYCCTGSSMFLLCDYPCDGTVANNLQCDDSAKNLSWKARWYIAVEIGGCLRYLHEECDDGPMVNFSVSSTHVVFSHDNSAMLCNFMTAKWLNDVKDAVSYYKDSQTAEIATLEEDERLYIDLRDYGIFLVELITGKIASQFSGQKGQSLVDWALALLNEGLLTEVMDSRLNDASDDVVAHQLANAALLCLKNDRTHRLSMSEVLVVVRGDQFAISNP